MRLEVVLGERLMRLFCEPLFRPAMAGALLAAVAPMLAACGLLSDPGFIAYTVGSEGTRNIGVVRADGAQARVVVADPADDFAPVWSPDGKRMAFLTSRDGNVELYVAPADGASAMRVTDTAVAESQPTWAPDSQSLAYVSPDANGNPHVFLVRLSDLAPRRLTLGTPGERDPGWSPNGEWVAFTALDEAGRPIGIFLRNPQGVNRLQVTQGPDFAPAWSPDSKRLAFVSERDGNQEIYAVEVGTGEALRTPVRLTENSGKDYAPEWSPDGKRVAFLSDHQGNVSIYSVSPRGKDLKALTTNEVDELAFAWGPAGELVFISALTSKPGLFVMSGDGAKQRQVVTAGEAYSLPDW